MPKGEEQKKLEGVMQSALATFAADPKGGLERLGWPIWGSRGKSIPLSLFELGEKVGVESEGREGEN